MTLSQNASLIKAIAANKGTSEEKHSVTQQQQNSINIKFKEINHQNRQLQEENEDLK